MARLIQAKYDLYILLSGGSKMSKNFENLNMNDKKEDRKAAYTKLIGLSILSSLAILSLWLLFPMLAHKIDPTGG